MTASTLFAHTGDNDMMTRRSAVGFVASLSALAVPAIANAASNESADDIVKRIAAKSEAANELAREKALEEERRKEANKDSGKLLVPAVALASVGLSLPFYLPNLKRLATKVSSGGEDDGYGNKK